MITKAVMVYAVSSGAAIVGGLAIAKMDLGPAASVAVAIALGVGGTYLGLLAARAA